jgi:hypothetical protein
MHTNAWRTTDVTLTRFASSRTDPRRGKCLIGAGTHSIGYPRCPACICERFNLPSEVRRCRLTASNPELKARLVSALETKM